LTESPEQKHLALTTHIGNTIKKYVRKVYPEIGPGTPDENPPAAPPFGGPSGPTDMSQW